MWLPSSSRTSSDRFSSFPTNGYFALSVEGLRHGFVWQLLTYQFMHGGLLHLLLNCWAIYVFGREVEETLGRNSFLTLYFTSGVIGGLFQALAGVLSGRRTSPRRWSAHRRARSDWWPPLPRCIRSGP